MWFYLYELRDYKYMALLYSYIFIYFVRPAEWILWLRLNWQLYLGIVAIFYLLFKYLTNSKEYNQDRYAWLVISFFLIALISKSLTGWFGGAINVLELLLPAIVIFFLIRVSCTDKSKLKSTLIFLLCLISFISVHVIVQYKTGVGFGGLAPMERTIGYDESQNKIVTTQATWHGTFKDPNDLGMLLVCCIPFIFQQIILKRILYVLPLILILTGIFLTNSRGTFLSLIVAVISFFLFRSKNIKGLMLAGVFCLIFLVFGPSRISQINTTEESAIGRLEAWIAAFQMFKTSPIYGIGPLNFTDHYFITAHNSYMLALSETGILGLFCFLGITVVPCWQGIKMIFNSENAVDDDLLIPLIAGYIGVCFSMFFISRTYVLLPYMMLGFVVSGMKIFNSELYDEYLKSVNLLNIFKTTFIFITVMYFIAKMT